MLKKKSLKLQDLRVTSFLTSEEARNTRGMTQLDTNCADTDCNSVSPMNLCYPPEEETHVGCPTGNTCVTCYNSCNGTCTCDPGPTTDPMELCYNNCQ